MVSKLVFAPQGAAGRTADWCLTPLMYLLQGNFRELPQRTHRWNNVKFHGSVYQESVSETGTYYDGGDSTALNRGLVRFHIPLAGGWRRFIVLDRQVPDTNDWYVGWHDWDSKGEFAGVSRIPLSGPVRVLSGNGPMRFFGLRPGGTQVPISCIGRGVIGKAGEYAQVPLL